MPLTDPQRWILAVAALYNERNKERHDLIGGAPRPEGAGRMMVRLGKWWDVYTPADAQRCLEWLATSGHREEYATTQSTSPEVFLGWDFVRLSAVAGWAYRGYLLDRDTAWSWMKRAARGVQAAFGSWAELGRSHLRGLAVWSEEPAGEAVLDEQRALAALLSRDGSPFLLPFDLDIEDAPPPDVEVREVHVAEGGSIAAAIEEAGPNGRVVLGPGIFRETVRPKHAVEIIGAGAENTVIEGDGRPALYVDPNLGVHASGLTLRAERTPKGDTLSAVFVSAGFVHLEAATITATHHGVALRRDGDAHLFGCRVVDCGKCGVEADGGNFVVLDTEIAGAGVHGAARFGGELCGVIAGSRIAGAGEYGIVAKGRAIVRDTDVVEAGKMGVVMTGSADLARTRIVGTKGWGLFLQDDAHVHVDECLVEGSQSANVDVKSGYASFQNTTIRGGRSSGINLQGAARAVFLGCDVEDNAQGNLYAVEGARHVFSGCTFRGGSLGIWTRGSVGYVTRCLVEGAAGAGISVLGAGGPVFSECEVRGSGGAGVEVAAGAAPRLARCKIEHSQGPGFSLAAGSKPAIEDCAVLESGAPDEIDGAEIALPGKLDPAPVLPPIAPSAEGFGARLDVGPALAAIFAARGGPPPPMVLSRALMHAVAGVLGDLDGVTVELDGTTIGVGAADQARAEAAREAANTMLREPHRLRAAADRVAMFDFAEGLAHGEAAE